MINMAIGAGVAGVLLLVGAALLAHDESDRSFAAKLFAVPAAALVVSAVGFIGAWKGY